ncbi:DUF6226 family protein [Solwaraspora sp. WMMA2056]|uniref:DUF6226 family protein n=1 Tax=Solwaraspora sp. WMMA2056 TaxID=3015161 RepID=UPI00259AEAB5|nr:DUF6226 family protein [Solwaraspora sp. WMMA2056]WJK43176.1 DUF6226 family protein [Solwaraspora sp. WMMA2056]
MTSVDELRARVTAAYDRLGLPAWPNPHAGMDSPPEEEYSRVTDPGRYAIVHARARVWADVLGDRTGVVVDVLGSGSRDVEGSLGTFDRGVRITPARPGTLPLLLLERDAPLDRAPDRAEGTLPVLHVDVARPGTAVGMLPDCGCDACDHGSQDLLDAIDSWVGQVVAGPMVLLRGAGWYARWHPDGGESGGAGRGPDHRQLMELCRRLADGQDVRLPERSEAFVGGPWFG